MHYILAKCWNNHTWEGRTTSLEKSTSFNNRGELEKMVPRLCPECGNACYNYILEYNDPSFIINKFNVRTFAGVLHTDIQALKNYPSDEILRVLYSENFVITKTEGSYPTKIYLENNKKQTAMIESEYRKKIGKLYLATPINDPIIKKIKASVKLENQKIIKTKIKITSMPDVIGTDLKIGDWVAFVKHNTINVAKIIKFNEKTLGLKDKKGRTYSAYSHNSSLLNEQQLLVFLLSN